MSGPGPAVLRSANLERLSREAFDVLVVGAGVNGAVSAAALAARGARVALVDRGDFASATSQESSNLIWGGIKYLETWELGLVRKLCRARNELLRAYPSSVKEIRFFTAHRRGFRHGRGALVLGAWLYWALGGFFTRRPRLLSRAGIAREEPVVALEGLDGGFEYSDAFLPDGDARFVWGFVRSALDHGCAAANYVESLGSRREGDGWVTRARDRTSGRELLVRSRLLVNACGPLADRLNRLNGVETVHRHVLSKGIHLLVDRLTPSERVLTFFADDGRLFFVVPTGPRTAIGTTDTPVDDPEVEVTAEDRRFVLDNINKRLRLPRPLGVDDVVAERCGVRPLVVGAERGGVPDWMQLSRRHVVETDAGRGHVTIFGGKLTDCVNVGEEMCAEVRRLGVPLAAAEAAWYGEPAAPVHERFLAEARAMGLDRLGASPAREALSARLWRRYGAGAFPLLEAVRRDPHLAEPVVEGAELVRCELGEIARREMVVKLEDFLRRRSGIAQIVRGEDLRRSAGLREACGVLFGDAAEARWAEHFGEAGAAPPRREPLHGSRSTP